MTSFLLIQDLRKAVGDRLLLEVDDLTLSEGTCTLLTGPNGAGKTTLLKLLAGLDAPDTATARYRGTPMPWRACAHRLRQEAVYLHQTPYMFDRSVAANVGYGLRRAGVSRSDCGRQVTEALEWAGLSHLSGQNARLLSGGERQRVALTRARVLNPSCLLLDEPMANMDAAAREQTLELVCRLRAEGLCILLTSHDVLATGGFADRQLSLRAGRLELKHGSVQATRARDITDTAKPERESMACNPALTSPFHGATSPQSSWPVAERGAWAAKTKA